jgi:hypothetical protein
MKQKENPLHTIDYASDGLKFGTGGNDGIIRFYIIMVGLYK